MCNTRARRSTAAPMACFEISSGLQAFCEQIQGYDAPVLSLMTLGLIARRSTPDEQALTSKNRPIEPTDKRPMSKCQHLPPQHGPLPAALGLEKCKQLLGSGVPEGYPSS